jgi:hypothetical protein
VRLVEAKKGGGQVGSGWRQAVEAGPRHAMCVLSPWRRRQAVSAGGLGRHAHGEEKREGEEEEWAAGWEVGR